MNCFFNAIYPTTKKINHVRLWHAPNILNKIISNNTNNTNIIKKIRKEIVKYFCGVGAAGIVAKRPPVPPHGQLFPTTKRQFPAEPQTPIRAENNLTRLLNIFAGFCVSFLYKKHTQWDGLKSNFPKKLITFGALMSEKVGPRCLWGMMPQGKNINAQTVALGTHPPGRTAW